MSAIERAISSDEENKQKDGVLTLSQRQRYRKESGEDCNGKNRPDFPERSQIGTEDPEGHGEKRDVENKEDDVGSAIWKERQRGEKDGFRGEVIERECANGWADDFTLEFCAGREIVKFGGLAGTDHISGSVELPKVAETDVCRRESDDQPADAQK